jgi:adenine phosphoribosyltransferase
MPHNIVVASANPLKVDGIKQYVSKYGIGVSSLYDPKIMNNNTPDQPLGIQSTLTCAINRMTILNSYLKSNGHPDDSPRYIVSIENGICKNTNVYDICIVLVKDRVTSKIYTNEHTIMKNAIKIPDGLELYDTVSKYPVYSKDNSLVGFSKTIGSLLACKYGVPADNWMHILANTDRKTQIIHELDSIWDTVMRETIMSHVRLINGFPNEKILFQDYMPVLYEFTPRIFLTHLIHNQIPDNIKFDIIAGPELRGVLFGNSLADLLKIGFIPLRKKNKLPPPVKTKTYDTEYDEHNTLEIDDSNMNPLKSSVRGMNVLLIDDVKGTGGSLKASIDLIEEVGGRVVYWVTINEVVQQREQASKMLAGYPGSVVFN